MVVAILVIAAPLTIGQGVDPDIKEKQEAVREAFADFPDRIGKQWEWLEISDVRRGKKVSARRGEEFVHDI